MPRQGTGGNIAAAILSLIVPGFGQLVQGRVVAAMAFLLAYAGSFAAMFYSFFKHQDFTLSIKFAPLCCIVCLVSVIDAAKFTPQAPRRAGGGRGRNQRYRRR